MLSKNYLLLAIKLEAYKYKSWVLETFSKTEKSGNAKHPLGLTITGKQYSFTNPITNQVEVIEDSDSTRPLFTFQDKINLKAGDLVNLKEDVSTTTGQVIVNAYMLINPFKDKVDYQAGIFDINKVEDEIAKRLVDDVQYTNSKSYKVDNPIYVSEYMEFIDSSLGLEGFSQLAVPSATPRMLSTDPNIEKRKKELLEQNKDNLDDPSVIANIEAELVEMDKQWMKGDVGEGFLTTDKQYGEVRKKLHIMYGLQTGFGETSDTATNSLVQGWGAEEMPGMVNALREASYARGKGTAMGGYETKIVNRMLQNVNIGSDDCGTDLGWDVTLTSKEIKNYIGFYYVNSSKKPVLITEDNKNSLVGKTIRLRSPQFCKEKGETYCKTCMGKPNSENENALSAYVAEITSRLMTLQMKAMHNTQLKNTTFTLDSIE